MNAGRRETSSHDNELLTKQLSKDLTQTGKSLHASVLRVNQFIGATCGWYFDKLLLPLKRCLRLCLAYWSLMESEGVNSKFVSWLLLEFQCLFPTLSESFKIKLFKI